MARPLPPSLRSTSLAVDGLRPTSLRAPAPPRRPAVDDLRSPFRCDEKSSHQLVSELADPREQRYGSTSDVMKVATTSDPLDLIIQLQQELLQEQRRDAATMKELFAEFLRFFRDLKLPGLPSKLQEALQDRIQPAVLESSAKRHAAAVDFKTNPGVEWRSDSSTMSTDRSFPTSASSFPVTSAPRPVERAQPSPSLLAPSLPEHVGGLSPLIQQLPDPFLKPPDLNTRECFDIQPRGDMLSLPILSSSVNMEQDELGVLDEIGERFFSRAIVLEVKKFLYSDRQNLSQSTPGVITLVTYVSCLIKFLNELPGHSSNRMCKCAWIPEIPPQPPPSLSSRTEMCSMNNYLQLNLIGVCILMPVVRFLELPLVGSIYECVDVRKLHSDCFMTVGVQPMSMNLWLDELGEIRLASPISTSIITSDQEKLLELTLVQDVVRKSIPSPATPCLIMLVNITISYSMKFLREVPLYYDEDGVPLAVVVLETSACCCNIMDWSFWIHDIPPHPLPTLERKWPIMDPGDQRYIAYLIGYMHKFCLLVETLAGMVTAWTHR